MKSLFVILSVVLCETLFAQESVVEVNGHKFGTLMRGFDHREKNMPAVIFENGMGDDLNTWSTVIDEIAKTAPVFSYNRLNVGNSDKVYEMPTIKTVSGNLKALLMKLNISPPYVVLGHSMGGVYARAFAGFYPNDVAGLIFVDPADFTESKDDWNSIFRAIGVSEKKIDEMMQERLYKNTPIDSLHYAWWSEGQVLNELRKNDFAEFKTLPMPNALVHFLVGGKFEVPVERRSKDFNHEQFFVVKSNQNMERWRKVIDSSPKGGMLVYLSNCGHYIHRDDPNAVVTIVKQILATYLKQTN